MAFNALETWNAWRGSPEVRSLAEAWIATGNKGWSDADEQLSDWVHSQPDKALATILAVVQLTHDRDTVGRLAAGHFEDFLGVQGERYIDTIHALALEHRRLREALDGVWQGAMPKLVWRRIELLKQSVFTR
jgi:hypothetical protein